jgi:hypothetical protein
LNKNSKIKFSKQNKGLFGMFDETLQLFNSFEFYATFYSCLFTFAIGFVTICILIPIEKNLILNQRFEAFLDSHPVVEFLVELVFYWIVFLAMNAVWRGIWSVSINLKTHFLVNEQPKFISVIKYIVNVWKNSLCV